MTLGSIVVLLTAATADVARYYSALCQKLKRVARAANRIERDKK
jgi:ERCC4-related helicase